MYRTLLAGAVLLATAVTPVLAHEPVSVRSVEAEFTDVVTDLEDAVINRGYVVDYHGYIGEMLQRTAEDVGSEKQLYRNAEFIQFCSAVLSREMMEADIGNIAFCPYVLFAYETEAEPGKVVVGFRELPEGLGRDAINMLLDEIVREVTGEE
ncbi:MAG: DUF302 domain-containing protein [Rhizobiaceae bacterium]|nr:DUF302 domain-containing protein [Rhizobiaceae bacterium]MCV0405401.1 DUF302 domain-containing protein [Rhizobiaceae bacterium]